MSYYLYFLDFRQLLPALLPRRPGFDESRGRAREGVQSICISETGSLAPQLQHTGL